MLRSAPPPHLPPLTHHGEGGIKKRALDQLVASGGCQIRTDSQGIDYYFLKEFEVAWAFTTTHLRFTHMKSYEYN